MDKSTKTKFAGSNSSGSGQQRRGRSGSRAGSQMGGSSFASSSARFNISRRSFAGSRSNLFSSSKQSLNTDASGRQLNRGGVKIFDSSGEDVTPLPLIESSEGSTTGVRKTQSSGGTGTQSTAGDSTALFAPGNNSFMQPFSRSVFATSMTGASTAGVSTMGSMMGSMTEEITTPRTPIHGSMQRDNTEEREEEGPQQLTAEDLDNPVEIVLRETDTVWLLDIPSTWVDKKDEEAETIREKNRQYEELVKVRPGNDRYSQRGMQTINDANKTKSVQTELIGRTDAEVYVSEWDMYDTLEAMKHAEQSKEQDQIKGSTQSSRLTSRVPTASTVRGSRMTSAIGTRTVTPSVMGSTATGTSIFAVSLRPDLTMMDTFDSPLKKQDDEDGEETKLDPTKPNDHPILKLPSLIDSLRTIERVVTLNAYQHKQATYRGLPILPDPDHTPSVRDIISSRMPHLEKLWSFSCPFTKGHAVTCMAWNPINLDILAVGFGDLRGAPAQNSSGLVCCWSLKNPEHPERVFHSPSGVTSLSFSQSHPNLLAAGLYNGSIVLFNARSDSHEPVLTSRDALFKHSGAVWKVEWVMKERSYGESRTEVLVSTAVDGRVLQWSIRKGFDSSQLIRLKRLSMPRPVDKKIHQAKSSHHRLNQKHKLKQAAVDPRAALVNPGRDTLLSQHAPGMGFTFCPFDTNIYLVSTEEGHIHKCSVSYNEQFLESYNAHSGPVYKVSWHPQHKDVFMSCSTDWTVRLWHQNNQNPLYAFQVAQKSEDRKGTAVEREAVEDIDWCPNHSTMFGCVTRTRVELWDFGHSVIDPLISQRPISGALLTCLIFSHNSDILLVGDSQGQVSVYLPKNIPSPSSDQAKALSTAIDSLEAENNSNN